MGDGIFMGCPHRNKSYKTIKQIPKQAAVYKTVNSPSVFFLYILNAFSRLGFIFTVYLLLWHGIGKSRIFAAQSTGDQ